MESARVESAEWRVDDKLDNLSAMLCKRGSSRVWRRFTDDQLEHQMLLTIETRRQTRIETPGSIDELSLRVSIRSWRRVSTDVSLL